MPETSVNMDRQSCRNAPTFVSTWAEMTVKMDRHWYSLHVSRTMPSIVDTTLSFVKAAAFQKTMEYPLSAQPIKRQQQRTNSQHIITRQCKLRLPVLLKTFLVVILFVLPPPSASKPVRNTDWSSFLITPRHHISLINSEHTPNTGQ